MIITVQQINFFHLPVGAVKLETKIGIILSKSCQADEIIAKGIYISNSSKLTITTKFILIPVTGSAACSKLIADIAPFSMVGH